MIRWIRGTSGTFAVGREPYNRRKGNGKAVPLGQKSGHAQRMSVGAALEEVFLAHWTRRRLYRSRLVVALRTAALRGSRA